MDHCICGERADGHSHYDSYILVGQGRAFQLAQNTAASLESFTREEESDVVQKENPKTP
jgi:hypothetical protein